MSVAPYYIEAVIHLVCHGNPKINEHVLEELMADGMIDMKSTPGNPSPSEKAKAWLELLCSTPFPVQKWVPS